MSFLFDGEDWSGAELHNIDFSGARIREANLDGARFSGFVGSMTVNGVMVWPLIAAELLRLHPERAKLKPTDAAGCREALGIVSTQLDETIARAQRLPEPKLHERVDDEWSATETVRHLVLVIDRWLGEIMLGGEQSHDPIALPNTADPPVDPDLDPTFDEALAAWRVREGRLRAYVEGFDGELSGKTARYDMSLQSAIGVIFDELWWHNRYMARDLTVLER